MMNQARTRKATAIGESGRLRPYTKALGETPKATKEPRDIQQNLRSKNRIPNNVRYDLENALVGLCDVWFEEIKPYLLRNNIKLHVTGGANRADEAEAGGDRGQLPPGAPGCSHLDPGAAPDRQRRRVASFAGCCSTQQVTLRTQSRKQLQPPYKLRAPLPSPAPSIEPKNQRNSEEQALPKTQVDRLRRRGGHPPNSQNSTYMAAPRLCRTYSSPSPLPAAYNYSTIMEEPSYTTRAIFEELATYSTTRDQSTQTDPAGRRRSPRRRNADKRPRRKNLPEVGEQHTKSKSPARPQKSPAQKSPAPTVRQKSKSPQREIPHRREREPSPPALTRPRHTSWPYSRHSPASHNSDSRHNPLCKDGLFDRIGAMSISNDMDVHVLYETPRKEENPANLNLIVSLYKNETVKKTAPWR